jgi:hypothetical protein
VLLDFLGEVLFGLLPRPVRRTLCALVVLLLVAGVVVALT